MQENSVEIRVAELKRLVGFLPGDGIGPEVAWPARRCVEAVGAVVEWEKMPSSAEIPPCRKAPAIFLMAPVEGGYEGEGRGPLSGMKNLMEVHASVRRLRSFGGGPSEGMDTLFIRPEGPPELFSRDFHKDDPDWNDLPGASADGATAATLRFVSRHRAMEFFEFAFSLAEKAGRKRVTVAHRVSAFARTEREWLDCAEDVSRRFPRLEMEDHLVDFLAMQMARSPQRYDVIIANELYGDVIGDLGVGLAGGLGMVPQVYYGKRGIVFTTVHGTAPKYAGLERANPCAMILAGSELLAEIGEGERGARITEAVRGVFESGLRTPDMAAGQDSGPAVGTKTFVNAVLYNIKTGLALRGQSLQTR
jgi:isocitrate dehydrogenase (NAD+)